MKNPGLYGDLGKAARDVLNDKYCEGSSVSVKATTDNGVTFTLNGNRNDAGAVSSDLATKYKHSSGVALSAKVDHTGNIKGDVTLDEVAPGLKVVGKGSFGDKIAAQVNSEYRHKCFTLALGVDVYKGPLVTSSTVLGYEGFAVGGEASYNTSGGALTAYGMGGHYKHSDFTLTGLYSNKDGKGTCTTSYIHKFGDDTNLAAEMKHSVPTGENTITAGAEHRYDADTRVFAKFDSKGNIAAAYEQKMRAASPKATLTLSMSANATKLDCAANNKIGIALAIE